MSADGGWQRDGPPDILATRDSAIHRHSCRADSVAVDRTHSDLVKYAEGESDYGCILHFLQDMISFSPQHENKQQHLSSFVSTAQRWTVSASGTVPRRGIVLIETDLSCRAAGQLAA